MLEQFTITVPLLTLCAAITGLVVQALKNLIPKAPANVLAIVSGLVIGCAGSFLYLYYNAIPFDGKGIIWLVCMGFFTSLSSMVGYDKVIQTIIQFKGE